MAATITRVNLLPTSRTIATGVPLAPRIAHIHPPQANAHHHNAARSDTPPKWAAFQTGFASVSRLNGGSGLLALRLPFGTGLFDGRIELEFET